MIQLTRLGGDQFVLNADLIERVDSTSDTVITLINGRFYVVAESSDEVLRKIRESRQEKPITHSRDYPPGRGVLRIVHPDSL